MYTIQVFYSNFNSLSLQMENHEKNVDNPASISLKT